MSKSVRSMVVTRRPARRVVSSGASGLRRWKRSRSSSLRRPPVTTSMVTTLASTMNGTSALAWQSAASSPPVDHALRESRGEQLRARGDALLTIEEFRGELPTHALRVGVKISSRRASQP
jgi:hypothetical protein